jgi:hypothetical protein
MGKSYENHGTIKEHIEDPLEMKVSNTESSNKMVDFPASHIYQQVPSSK